MHRPLQATQDVVVVVPLMKRDGTMASRLNTVYMYTKLIGPDGVQITGYTAPTISEPNNDGIYVLVFPTDAVVKAFTISDADSPHTLVIGSSETGVIPFVTPVWIYEAA